MDAYVHFEKDLQLKFVGPDFPSFMIYKPEIRFYGGNSSHIDMKVCTK